MDKNDLLKLIKDDDLGLLNCQSKQEGGTADDRLLLSFQQINNFVKENGREPEESGGINEHQLYSRLRSIREDSEKLYSLLVYDEHKLLEEKAKEIKTIDDIFESDDLGIFNCDENDIFNLKNLPKEEKERAEADFIARRKSCKDFAQFEQKFIQCHKELKDGKRRLLPFREDYKMAKGMFFVLKGMLVYLAEVGEKIKDQHGKWDARLRAIFENGTESDLLLRSLGKALFKDGRRISELAEKSLDNFYNINEEDKETGYIYVVKYLGKNEEIKQINNLYKIGFSRTVPEERIKNAEQDPTYLMSAVEIVVSFRCFNVNPQKLELLLHNFFAFSCLDLEIFGNNGKKHIPREWFVAPLNIIEQAINLVLSGKIVDYRYDLATKQILEK